MKTKRLSLALVALLLAAGGGLWFARSAWRPHAVKRSSADIDFVMPGGPKPDQMLPAPARLAPPDPTRRFRDFTPEQRVEFARKGHGPGG